MKKTFYLLLAFFFSAYAVMAQEETNSTDQDDDYEISEIEHISEGLTGSFNYANIGGMKYVGLRFKPELSFGKLGFGLDVPLLFNIEDGSLRMDEFKDGVGLLRMIRYFRYGVKKRDPLYFRIGVLDDSELGFGGMISEYNNSPSFEKRKLGLEFDFVVKKKFGLELLYSDLNLTSFNLLGVRPYYKPFGATDIPVIKTFEIGVGFITDHDQTAWVKSDSILARNNYFLENGITAYQADMGFYLFNWRWLRWTFYTQAGMINRITSDSLQRYIDKFPDEHRLNYRSGYGFSVGSDFKFRFLGNLLKINARVEKFWNTDYYISRFFNYAYEMDKDMAVWNLVNAQADHGTYAMLHTSVLDKIILKSSIKFLDRIDEDHPAEFYGGIDLSGLSKKITFYTGIYQAEITDFTDIFYLTDRTLFHTRAGYTFLELKNILQFNAGLDVRWTYALIKNRDYTATHYVSPYFSITMPLKKEKKEQNNKDVE